MKLLLKNEGEAPLELQYKDAATGQDVIVLVEPNGFAHLEQAALGTLQVTEKLAE